MQLPNACPSANLIRFVAGYTYLISFFAAAWAILCTGWMHNAQPCDAERIAPHGCGGAPIKLTVQYLILGMFCAGSVMISFGGVLGRISILQLFIMALLEVNLQRHSVHHERERKTADF
jgi:ammonium transporter Rh